MKKWLRLNLQELLDPKYIVVWSPDSPGVKYIVRRTRIGRAFKDDSFATMGESVKGIPYFFPLTPMTRKVGSMADTPEELIQCENW